MTEEQIGRDSVLILDQYIAMQRKVISQTPTPDGKLVAILNAIEACRHDGAPRIAFVLTMMVVFVQHASDDEQQRHIDCLAANKKVREVFSGLRMLATHPAAPSRN